MQSDTLTLHPEHGFPLRDAVMGLLALAAAGFIAIAISGAVAWGFAQIGDEAFVAGDPPDVAYTAERCADFLEYYPNAGSCEAAATAHHYDEVVGYRIDAGVLGLIALGILYAMKRSRKPVVAPVIPALLVPTIAAVLFGLAAFGLLAFSLMQWAYQGSAGVGADLSGGLVAAVAFVIASRRSGVSLLRCVWPV